MFQTAILFWVVSETGFRNSDHSTNSSLASVIAMVERLLPSDDPVAEEVLEQEHLGRKIREQRKAADQTEVPGCRVTRRDDAAWLSAEYSPAAQLPDQHTQEHEIGRAHV